MAAASATLPAAECSVEEGKERRRRRGGEGSAGVRATPGAGRAGGRADGARPSGTRDDLRRRAAVVRGRLTRDFGRFPPVPSE